MRCSNRPLSYAKHKDLYARCAHLTQSGDTVATWQHAHTISLSSATWCRSSIRHACRRNYAKADSASGGYLCGWWYYEVCKQNAPQTKNNTRVPSIPISIRFHCLLDTMRSSTFDVHAVTTNRNPICKVRRARVLVCAHLNPFAK